MPVLVLTRRHNESIMIGEDVEITVRHIRGGQVKLAIAAPPAVRVWRTEIWRKRRERGAPVPARRTA